MTFDLLDYSLSICYFSLLTGFVGEQSKVKFTVSSLEGTFKHGYYYYEDHVTVIDVALFLYSITLSWLILSL